MVHWRLWMFPFSHSLKNIESHHSYLRMLLNTSPILSGVGGFVGRLISLFPMSYMCLILLNMHLFSWRFVLIMPLSLQAVITRTLLYFPVGCWIEMDYKTCYDDVGYFLPMLGIQKNFLFLSGSEWFHGLLFSYWWIYYMLWCSHYCVIMPMGVSLGGN